MHLIRISSHQLLNNRRKARIEWSTINYRTWVCGRLSPQPVLKILLINRLITLQSCRALSSLLSQPPEGGLVILVCSEVSHPWKQDPGMTLCLPAGPVTCRTKQGCCATD